MGYGYGANMYRALLTRLQRRLPHHRRSQEQRRGYSHGRGVFTFRPEIGTQLSPTKFPVRSLVCIWLTVQGYKYSVFNLVFENNIASVKIWDKLGFKVIGRVPGCARLENSKGLVDALIYGRELGV